MDWQLVAGHTQTIYVATAAATRDAQGQPTWGSPAARSVRVERSDRIVPGPNGEDLKTSHLIFTETAIGKADCVWLPGDNSATASLARRPMLIEAIPAEDSGTTDHWEVYL